MKVEMKIYDDGTNLDMMTQLYEKLMTEDKVDFGVGVSGIVKIGERVGAEKLHHTLRLFGFGQKTGIDSPAETSGLLMHHKRWTDIDTAAISFGHGVSVSAVQLIAAFSAIANDGVLMRPRMVQAITDQQGQILQQFAPEAVRRVVSSQTASTLRDILQTVMLPGGPLEVEIEGRLVWIEGPAVAVFRGVI